MMLKPFGAVCAAGLVLAACAASPSNGPIDFGEEIVEWCAPTLLYEEVAFGLPLDISGDTSAILQSVEAVGAHGVTVADAKVMPVRPEWRLALDEYPPTGNFREEWADSEPLSGFELKPDTNIDLVVRATYIGPGDASLEGLRLIYLYEGSAFQAASQQALLFSISDCE